MGQSISHDLRSTGMVHKIADPLKEHAIPVADLWTLPGNPRQGDVGAVSLSLERFGQRKPIVYQQREIDGEQRDVVIAGNHTLAAARALGWDMVAAVDASDLTEEEAQAYAIADNRTSDLATNDNELLAEMLSGIATSDMSCC